MLRISGFTFARHPMLVNTDRKKYNSEDRRVLRTPADRLRRLFPGILAIQTPGRTEQARHDPCRAAADLKVSPKYLPLVWGILEEGKEEAGPIAKLQSMWRMLPTPAHNQPDLVREGCVKMRDYVVKMRKLTALQFRSPRVTGLSGTSQPLMNWKLRAYASHRRGFDPTALQVEGEPPLKLPFMGRMGGVPTEDQVAVRNTALAVKARSGDPDLIVPAGLRAQYEASFARFSSVFPDAFYIRERGRFYPDDMFEVVRVPRADVTAMVRHRVFRCDYLDRSSTDLRADVGAAAMNQRPPMPMNSRRCPSTSGSSRCSTTLTTRSKAARARRAAIR